MATSAVEEAHMAPEFMDSEDNSPLLLETRSSQNNKMERNEIIAEKLIDKVFHSKNICHLWLKKIRKIR